jgi:hypothetical protein
MDLDDLKRDWTFVKERPVPPPELQALFQQTERRCHETERVVYSRDLREIVAALVVVGAFAAILPLCRSSPASMLGVAIIIAGGLVIVAVLLVSRKPAPLTFDLSMLEFCRRRLAWLDGQIRLLQTVVWWYVAPMTIGCLFFHWGLAGGLTPAFAVAALLTLAIAAGIVVLNHYAVRHAMEPVREQVVRLIETLEAGDPK